ncbi:hypothetical protein [Cryobacterium ruanii]|uniref:hypothetical protein n=1 Tax=Cryobacterium ruanii TaxID=1259197 RepID=UPI00141BCAF5|nr:hypothetical protein [Cryobacterium ruanii]
MWLDVVPASAVDPANGTPQYSQVGAIIRSHIAGRGNSTFALARKTPPVAPVV